MALAPDYTKLDAENAAHCHRWNSDITMANGRQLALANPPSYLKLLGQGYDTYDEAKEELDRFTRAAGYVTTKIDSGTSYARLECARGRARKKSVATRIPKTATIKQNCPWTCLISKNKESRGKWTYKEEPGNHHENHGPQDVPESQRGWQKLTPEIGARLESIMADNPATKPRYLVAMVLRDFPAYPLGKNTIKNWLQDYRKRQRAASFQTPPEDTADSITT